MGEQLIQEIPQGLDIDQALKILEDWKNDGYKKVGNRALMDLLDVLAGSLSNTAFRQAIRDIPFTEIRERNDNNCSLKIDRLQKTDFNIFVFGKKYYDEAGELYDNFRFLSLPKVTNTWASIYLDFLIEDILKQKFETYYRETKKIHNCENDKEITNKNIFFNSAKRTLNIINKEPFNYIQKDLSEHEEANLSIIHFFPENQIAEYDNTKIVTFVKIIVHCILLQKNSKKYQIVSM